jgi:predicted nucleotidyltransferase
MSVGESTLQSIKEAIASASGSRFKGVILYGSEVRGASTDESDIDLMALLDGPIDVWKDTRAIVGAIYPLQLRIDRLIHVTPADANEFAKAEFSLYRNVKREGRML